MHATGWILFCKSLIRYERSLYARRFCLPSGHSSGLALDVVFVNRSQRSVNKSGRHAMNALRYLLTCCATLREQDNLTAHQNITDEIDQGLEQLFSLVDRTIVS